MPDFCDISGQPLERDDPESIERVLGPARPDLDEVRVSFDWRPIVTDNRVSFLYSILRGEVQSSTEFEVNLGRLTTDELGRLLGILAKRHAGVDSTAEIAQAVSWLLNLSLAQAGTPADQVDVEVRALLLVSIL